MAGVGFELTGAGDADIGAVVVDDGRAGAHGGICRFAGVVVELQRPKLADLPDAVLGRDAGLIEIAALGREVIGICLGVIADRAAQIAGNALAAVQQLAGFGVEHQKARRVISRVASLTVIRADKQEIIADIRARPVESAELRDRPGWDLALVLAGRILIRDRQADVIAVFALILPEAGIEIAVIYDDRAVRLAADLIHIQPEGFQRLRVKGLNAASGEADEEHAVIIGRRVDGEAGAVDHGAGRKDLAGDGVDPEELIIGIRDQVAVHEDRAADRIFIKALAQLIGPVEHGLCRADRHRAGDDAVIAVLRAARNKLARCFVIGIRGSTKIGPFRFDRMIKRGILFGCGQRQRERDLQVPLRVGLHVSRCSVGEGQDGLPIVCVRGAERAAFSDIAQCRQVIVIGKALGQAPRAVLIRPDPHLGAVVDEDQQCVLRCQGRCEGDGRGFLDGQTDAGRLGRVV